MDTLLATEQQICELIKYRVRVDWIGTLDLILSCARVFRLAKNLAEAPSSQSTKDFLVSYQPKLPILLLDYISDVYEGRKEIPYIADPQKAENYGHYNFKDYRIHEADFVQNREIFLSDEQESHLVAMTKVFIRLECQVKC